ncbi:MAG: DUF2786 domain-containing protein [Treponema sp.]|jgi:hypothetical protein|nr:DUF2786 domain-containing protein [Treponema sp.]
MSDIEKIKAKIKKLLMLSSSPNPHEAASALAAAQKLMAEYNVGAVNRLDITEERAGAIYRENTPRYETLLTSRIAEAFGCRKLYVVGASCTWRFIGISHRAQIAAYITQILLRRLRTARAEYVKTLNRVRKRYRKTQRADVFCLAWVSEVTRKLPAFAGCDPEERDSIIDFYQRKYPNTTTMKPGRKESGTGRDFQKGLLAGNGVQLQHGVSMGSPAPLLQGGAG